MACVGGALWADDRPKAFREGTHRVEAPEATLDAVRPLLSRIGVTRLGEITGLDPIGLPVAQAVRPMGRSLSVAQGKGATRSAALASAAMEAVETWHAENVELPAVAATRGALSRSERALPLAGLSRRDAAEDELDGAEMRWVNGILLADGSAIRVPLDCTTMDFTQPPDTDFLVRSSNGLASGRTLAEATASALFELIERDCVAAFRGMDPAGGRAGRRVPRAALAEGSAGAAVAAIEASGARLDVWDITNDLGVPTYLARISDPQRAEAWHALTPSAGSGSHLDPEVALLRAIHEAAQSRATRMAGARDDLSAADYAPAGEAHHLLVLDAMFDAGAEEPRAHPDESRETSAGDVDVLVGRLARAGLDAAAMVDLSRPGTGVAVVRAVVPGLAIALPRNRYLAGMRGPRPARARE